MSRTVTPPATLPAPPHPYAAGRTGSAAGSALLVALWALMVIAMVVLGWAKFIDQEMVLAGERNLGLAARAYAYSGLTIALHPGVSRDTPLLEASWGEDRGYKVQMSAEGGRLDLNWLLAGEDAERLLLLKNYLEQRGLSFQERELLVDCLLDWVDPDDAHHLNGVEKTDRYQAANRPFQSVEELRQVFGADPLLAQPGWEDDFTVHNNAGGLDPQFAPEHLLALLPDVGDARAARFVQLRQGPDGRDGTADDFVFSKDNKQQQILSLLGIPPGTNSPALKMLVFNSQVWRIRSTGTMGKVHRQIEVVARKGGGKPEILLWKEH